MFSAISDFMRETADAQRFFSDEHRAARQLVFYSESASYFRYFEGIYKALESKGIPFSYISSDPRDPVFGRRDNVAKFFIKSSLPAVFSKMDSKLLLMTLTELGSAHLPKPSSSTNCVYLFHALVSTHLQYKLGAFNNYDTVLLAGPHHMKELRESESIYGSNKKRLVEYGYCFSERLFEQAQQISVSKSAAGEPTALLAPTWSNGCILESCLTDLLSALSKLNWRVIVRPHPEFAKRYPSKMRELEVQVRQNKLLEIESASAGNDNLISCDLLITDRSGICFEYSIARNRPVLFIDTPLKIQNPDYLKLSSVPVEIATRARCGLSIKPQNISEALPATLQMLESRMDEFSSSLAQLRDELQYNWLSSSDAALEFLRERLD